MTSEKRCKCGTTFVRPDWASDRQWSWLKRCQDCERIELRRRIEGDVKLNDNGCWIWQKSCAKMGYGQISVHNVSRSLHRLAYEAYRGPIPNNLEVCHRCDVRACCNPEHLFLGTRLDNVSDMIAKGRGSKPPLITGTANPKAVLSFAEVEEVRRLRTSGMSQRAVAKLFNCGQATIWNIAHRRTRASG